MLKTRILTAVIGIPFLVIFLIADPIFLAALSAIAAVVGLYEYFRACGIGEKIGISCIGYAAGAVLTFGYLFSKEIYLAIFVITLLALFCQLIFNHKNVDIEDISKVIFGVMYIAFFFSFVNYIRTVENGGNVYIWLMFLGAFITDTCAYFVGCAIGKHKLCPSISPKKTIEGSVGGIIGTGVVFIGFACLMNFLFAMDISIVKVFILGLISAVVSQIGDLTASVIKRKYNIKDFGNLLPGHGGILDRCDSVLTVAPIMYLFLVYIGL